MPLPPPERADRALWLRLALTPGVGAAKCRQLLQAAGSPQAVLTADVRWLGEWLSASQVQALRADDPLRERRVAASLRWAEADDCHLLTLHDPDYPERLHQLADPPTVLFVRGNPALPGRKAVAIVGSRQASATGCRHAQDFARALAGLGLTVVSGLALGIDAAAHRGALGTAAGTVAVVGHGPEAIYPARNRALGEAIAREGAVVSEFAPGEPPLPAHFPRRNRLIAALSLGVLVVEAAHQSGSLITANVAANLGGDVFAVPGSIDSPLSKGCHELIRQGARMAESVDDVLDELAWGRSGWRGGSGGGRKARARADDESPSQERLPGFEGVAPTSAGPSAAGQSAAGQSASGQPPAGLPAANPASRALLDHLGWDPAALDELAARSRLAPAELTAGLLRLELAGLVGRLPDGRFQRNAAACEPAGYGSVPTPADPR